MGQKSTSNREELKPKPVFLNIGPPTILSAPEAEKNRTNFWILGAWILSLLFHGALVFLWSPELEKIAFPTAKKPLEAELKFKPVVLTDPLNKTRPEKAHYLAEVDQSAEYPEKSITTKPKAVKKTSERARAFKAPNADTFLAKPRAADPLGLHENSPAAKIGEHLPDVEPGKNTQLNAWSWRHAPFFNRIKTQIGQVWAPNRQIARYDPQGALLGQIDRVTVLSVTIDAQGKLKMLQVANSSGVAYLDEEAERAFKKAAPFPFPPKDLFNIEDGFTFQFAFHLQQNKGMKFDFDWHKGD